MNLIFTHYRNFHPHNWQYPIQQPAAQSVVTAGQWVAIGTLIVTLLAVIVALFQERFWKWWERPKIQVSFDSSSDRCYRFALISNDFVQEVGLLQNVKRQYFRLRVLNDGKTTVKNLKAKVEIFDLTINQLGERFEPSALNWISGQHQTDLAPQEDDYVNLISQIIERDDVAFPVRVELADTKNLRGIGWDRFFRPFKFRVTFYADNLRKPVVKFFKFSPQDAGSPGHLGETLGWG